MPTISNWTGTTATNRAEDAWARISDKPSSVVFRRKNVNQAAQTVRLEYRSGTGVKVGETVSSAIQGMIVFGIKDHPTLSDTDMQRGDRFTDADGTWEIDQVMTLPGEVQGLGRRLT